MSHFAFVDDKVLRRNLDTALEHIVDLLAISESESYKNENLLVSSMRKTVIIHTASIIEALLLWRLKQKIKSREVELGDEWRYFDIRVLYTVDVSNEDIIAGKRKREKKELDRLDFVRIIDFCSKYRIVNETLSTHLHKVRELRNRLHIGGLKQVEKEYTYNDLKFAFDVAKKVKQNILG